MHQVVAVGDATGVGDDDRRAVVRLGLQKGLRHVSVVAAHRHPRHIDGAVADGAHGQILLSVALAASGKLGHRAARRGFGHLPAGIRVDLSVQHQHIHVLARGEHVVQPAEADVVGPAVAAQNPYALSDQRVGDGQQVARVTGIVAGQLAAQRRHALALLADLGFRLLRGR